MQSSHHGTLVSSAVVPAGGTCSGKACWKANAKGFQYKSKTFAPDGVAQLKLKAGSSGKTQLQVKAQGSALALPTLGATLTGPLRVQLHHGGGTVCWDAAFSAPFGKNDGVTFNDKSD